jgi:hypothetical protein
MHKGSVKMAIPAQIARGITKFELMSDAAKCG